DFLEKNGIRVKVVTSEGSTQNLERLTDPKSGVDLGIAQAGIMVPGTEGLEALGSISYQPLFLFYRGKPIELVSELAGKAIVVGPEGSGTHNFAMQILKANGIVENGPSKLLGLEGEAAAKALFDGEAEAAFVMSESSSVEILRKLLRSSE